MQRRDGRIVLGASDIVDFLACEHLTALDLRQLDSSEPPPAHDEQAQLLARKGREWEARHLDTLRTSHPDLVAVPAALRDAQAGEATLAAMQQGVSLVYQARLLLPGHVGRADFLRRVPGRSRFGDWAYEVLDTKLGRAAKAGHVLQLCFYSWLVGELSGAEPAYMYVVTDDGREHAFRYADYSRYLNRLRARARAAVEHPATDTYPHPCARCATCRWNEACEARREADDHLWQVANIRRRQIVRLSDAGIRTMRGLAAAPEDQRVPKMTGETFLKLRAQAAMHVRGREEGPCYDLLPPQEDRGFARLPPPSEGDVYFDMEGDPLIEDGGLEYLFGVSWRENGGWQFRAFWAHDRAAEKQAFEGFVDWLEARRARWPDLHVYHYAAYETTALKRLMSTHATREAQVDALLRERRLVDLFRVVAEALRSSTPSYSLKDIEIFYRGKRSGEVVDAGSSIVWYERWRDSADPQLLADIEAYNRDDCESTAHLHEWLRSIRPAGLPWRSVGEPHDGKPDEDRDEKRDARAAKREGEQRARDEQRDALLASLPADEPSWSRDHALRHLTACLMDFHRREAKPAWWKIFSCADLSVDELIEDLECIGGMRRVAVASATGRGRLPTWTYEFPEQELKARCGDELTRADTHAKVTLLELDEAARRLQIKPSGKALLPDAGRLSLGPKEPIDTTPLREAVARFAASVRAGDRRYAAVESLLRIDEPRVAGVVRGEPLLRASPAVLPDISAAIAALERSYVFVQGPPGAGKTWAGARVIVDLLQAGRRVGVSSNSHKAICNLLREIESVALERGFSFVGCKKGSKDETQNDHHDGRCIRNVYAADEALAPENRLVAGTAWLFADPLADQAFDHLFVDEAGQVSLGHLVAMGVAARNIVLLGDQMQLGQPIQGVHPGRSGESALDYLLDGRATVDRSRGIFLATTYRMHPDVCGFVSDAVYDGRLQPAPSCALQALVLDAAAHAALCATGIVFLPVEHDGCTQRSEEEAGQVAALYESLLGQRWRNAAGEVRPITNEDILVVAPYNLQVNHLRAKLPRDARVGTVDKFQGQEAAVVIVSLTTSNGDCLPRNIEFLYSKNRLNVAVSRARCLAVVVASPDLLDIPCNTPEQIALVNTLCWVRERSR